MVSPLIGIVKLPLVVPLLVTVAVSYWLPSTYRVTTFVPVPCTVYGITAHSVDP